MTFKLALIVYVGIKDLGVVCEKVDDILVVSESERLINNPSKIM